MAVQIPCPRCGSVLKLRDRSMLGRTGKCPKCAHRFELTEAAVQTPADEVEVELELAETPAENVARPATARRVRNAASAESTAKSAPAEVPAAGIPLIVDPPAAQSYRPRRRGGRQRRTSIIIGGLVALAAFGTAWAGYRLLSSQSTVERPVADAPPAKNVEYLSERDRLARMAELIAEDSPTTGEPVTLAYVPAGASIVIHLRPAELWKPGSIGEEVRYCLGEEFANWSQSQIEKYCLLPPSEIAEATICLILAARGSEPQIATVVRPLTPRKTSELIGLFDGSPQDVEGKQVFVGADRAAIIGHEIDDQKRPLLFATAPASMAPDLALAADAPGLTGDAVEMLLEQTDRDRHATFVFPFADLKIHEETLVSAERRPAWNAMLDRFGNADGAAWSLHFDGDEVVSEFVVRSSSTTTSGELRAELSDHLDRLPGQFVDVVSKMNPAEIGDRKLIGRFPAMTQLAAAATVAGIDDRMVLLQTRLPERAGPNLALAGLLTWHESTRPAAAPASPGEMPQPSKASLAERLKKPVEVEFSRTPLEEAFGYLFDETGVAYEIDGDALKLAAYTRNMPQTFSLGTVPAEKGIAAMTTALDKLAVVLDEAGNKAIVTTKAGAEAKGMTPTTFSP